MDTKAREEVRRGPARPVTPGALPSCYSHVVHQIGKLRHPWSGIVQHIAAEMPLHPFGFMRFATGLRFELLL
ncbi:MAG: hypothetical protein KGJ91_10320, partial [Xanthomonadaceae bacterium]|nr:hypothetical protein [Xanthomonadaceae bacterium]